MKVYVVEALRWGSRENHSYVQAVHQDLAAAEDAGRRHREDRDNKYEWMVTAFDLDKGTRQQVAKSEHCDIYDQPDRGNLLELCAQAAEVWLSYTSIYGTSRARLTAKMNLSTLLTKLGYEG